MARSVMRGNRQWMPFVRRSTWRPRSLTPASSRKSSTHGPAAFTMTRAPSVATVPGSKSRAVTPATAPRLSRTTDSTWQ